jgi:hypothetical protein
MFGDTESIVKKYLNSGEEILWSGHPVTTRSDKPVLAIRLLLLIIGLAFIFYAAYVFVVKIYLVPADGGLPPGAAAAARNKIIFGFVGALFFWVFRYILSRSVKQDTEQIFYAITNQRALAIDDGNEKILREWGAGDVQKVSVRKRGDSGGDLLFAEEAHTLGKIDEDDGGGERTPLQWVGFENIDDIANAANAIKAWRKLQRESNTIQNEKLKFRISIPNDWSGYSYMIDREHRDNLFFSILSAELIGEDRLLKNVKVGGEWDTLILAKRISEDLSSDFGRLYYMVILVEAALRDEMPIASGKMFTNSEKVNLETFAKDPHRFFNTLKKTIMICEFNNLCDYNNDKQNYKVRVNKAAKKDQLNAMKSFKMEGSLNIMGNGYKFKQIYSYQPLSDKLCLHFRYTFFCTDKDKEKHYKENHNVLETIVKSVRALTPENVKAEGKPGEID